jgi:NTE family protein
LDSIFKNSDYEAIINDKFSRESKSFHERDNSEKYIVGLPFDKLKLSLPSGLSRGQKVYNLLYQLMFHVNDVKDFKDLPIPFFCIATNVETGESVSLDKGSLALSVSASGAFPSLFQPVVINDMLYIDGGVTNNYPIKKLKEKGMDIIIGVDVQDDLKNRDDLKAATDILFQINNFRAIDDMKEKIEITDIYIKPDITDFSVISFNEAEHIIKNGEQATKIKLNELVNLRNRLQPTKPTQKVVIKDSIIINEITITGNKNYTRSYILGKLKLKDLGKISYNTFNICINNLAATNNFDAFNFELIKSKNKEGYDLIANIKEREATTFMKFGLHYDDLYKSAALINLTKKRLLFNNDVASIDLIVGDNVRYNFEYFIDKGFYLSIGIKSRFNQFNKNIDPSLILDASDLASGINKIDVELQDQTNQIYLQTLFARDFILRLGGEHKRLKIKSETLVTENPEEENETIFENTDYFSLFGTLKIDSYSDKYFPKNGFYLSGDFHLYLTASDFNRDFSQFSIAKANFGYAFSVFDRLAFNITAQGGFKIGDDSTQSLDFSLGGYGTEFINNFMPFYGYDFVSLSGDSFVKTTVTADYEIFKKHHITLSANYSNIEDNIFETGEWFSAPDYTGYALGYGVETFLGPLETKFSYSPETRQGLWYFSFGFWF